jgi:hypothetical protein
MPGKPPNPCHRINFGAEPVEVQGCAGYIIEQSPGAFIEHVGIELVRFQQRDPPLPLSALELEAIEFARKRHHLLVNVLLGLEAAVAAVGIDAEIADQKPRHDVKAERGKDRAETLAGYHPANMRNAA